MSPLRDIDDSFPPIKDRAVTLLCFDGPTVTQTKTVTGKRAVLDSASPTATLVAIWNGEWSADAFRVNGKVLREWKQTLGCSA